VDSPDIHLFEEIARVGGSMQHFWDAILSFTTDFTRVSGVWRKRWPGRGIITFSTWRESTSDAEITAKIGLLPFCRMRTIVNSCLVNLDGTVPSGVIERYCRYVKYKVKEYENVTRCLPKSGNNLFEVFELA
jgi:hypothetical protein